MVFLPAPLQILNINESFMYQRQLLPAGPLPGRAFPQVLPPVPQGPALRHADPVLQRCVGVCGGGSHHPNIHDHPSADHLGRDLSHRHQLVGCHGPDGLLHRSIHGHQLLKEDQPRGEPVVCRGGQQHPVVHLHQSLLQISVDQVHW